MRTGRTFLLAQHANDVSGGSQGMAAAGGNETAGIRKKPLKNGTLFFADDYLGMNSELLHYGIGTAFVALVAASAIFSLSQISMATQSSAESAPDEVAAKERSVRVVLESPFGR